MNKQFKIYKTFVELLLEKASDQPNSLAIRSLADNYESAPCLTFEQLNQKAQACAAVLQAFCPPGDRALILLPSGINYVAAFFGCLYAGLIAVPAYPPESRKHGHLERLIGILHNATPRVILTTSGTFELFGLLRAELSGIPSPELVFVDELDSSASASWQMPALNPDQIAFLQYTSGSTSAPKGVKITHTNLIANEIAIRDAFGFDENDSVVSWLPLYHDMGLIGGLLQPIFNGVPVTLMSPRQFLERPVRWFEAISRYKGTVSGGPDFAFRLCSERVGAASLEEIDLRSWRLAFCGAEPVRLDTTQDFVARFKQNGFDAKSFYPCFGLAEATLLVTGGAEGSGVKSVVIDSAALGASSVRLTEDGTTVVSCGSVQDDHEIIIVDPQTCECLDTTKIGEIWVSGPSVSHGYWNDADATAESLVVRDKRVFLRTGDLGFMRDGDLFVTGRLKDLIIIRGQNIYPADVERIIESEVDILRRGRIAAFAINLKGRERIGIAAEVSRSMQKVIDSNALVQAINIAISDVYQEVASLILLLNPDGLPKTSSGKLQRTLCELKWRRGALDVFAAYEDGQANSVDNEDAYKSNDQKKPPNPDVERAVAEIWKAVLQIDSVVPNDHFFLLGGSSVSAMQLTARLQDHFEIRVDVREIFENPIFQNFVDQIAYVCRLEKPEARFSIPRAVRSGDLALSHAQSRLWFLWHLVPLSPAYNIAGAVRLRGYLNERALERAFEALVERHEALRTTFEQAADGSGLQRINASTSIAVIHVDLSLLDAGEREIEVRRQAQVESEAPFDLEVGPLLRVSLLKCSAQNHVLLVTLHHIVSDAWSMRIVVDEFAQLYTAYVQGLEPSLPELPIQYGDYAIWQRAWLEAGESERQLTYWKEKLGSEHPVLELRTDRPRPASQTYRGAVHAFEADSDLTQRLRCLAQEHNATLFMLMLAAFKTLLYRYTGQTDLRVGVPTANRTRVETEGLIGFFVNTQVLRTDVDGRLSFIELLERVRETALGAQAHQDLPFEQLVEALQPERSLSHQPLFQVMLNHQRDGKALRHLPDLEIEAVEQTQQTTKFDLMLDVVEHDRDLSFAFTYASDLFESEMIGRLSTHFQHLLEAITADASLPLADLQLLSEAEKTEILDSWSRGEDVEVARVCLHGLIEARVRERPDAAAVVYEETSLSYGELNAKANQLARHLRMLGVGSDVLVGLAVERSLEMVVGLLGILKAGGACVPLDPGYPQERLAFMIEDAGLDLILTQEHLLDDLGPLADGQSFAADDVHAKGTTLLCLDRDWSEIAGHLDTDLPNIATPQNLAYCIYTSGSTGKPKGAGNSHAGIVNRLRWMQREYGLTLSDRVLQKTPFSFDVSVWEFFWPLSRGAILVIAPPEAHQDPAQLRAIVVSQQVTVLHFVPSMLQAFVISNELAQCGSLRQIMCSGETLSYELQRGFQRQHSGQLHNLYGPTEAAIDVSFWRCREEAGCTSVPIGGPIWNTQLYILDAALNPAPAGIVGELYIGGAGLARGYHGRPGLTAERFVPNPFGREPGERLYRTGDLARWRADGVIDYVGRVDHQVKIRGFRIELGEIEARLLAHDKVREAVVVAREAVTGKQLIGYVVMKKLGPDAGLVSEDGRRSFEAALGDGLRAHVQAVLPDYMVPARVVVLDRMPLTPNGKFDRKALPEPDFAGAEYIEPSNEIECKLVAIWQDVLGLERVGVTDNFFELGGDSILSLQIIARARREGLKLTPKNLFEKQTVQELLPLVQVLDAYLLATDLAQVALVELTQAQIEALPVEAREIEDVYPLSPMQQGMLFHALHAPAAGLYLNQLSVPVEGLDVDRFKEAFAAVAARHAILRTSFVWEGDVPQPLQIVHKTIPLPVEELDWRDRIVRAEDLADLSAAEHARGFDLTRAPLQRMVVVRLGEGRDHLIWTHHHLLLDGWSTAREIEEVFAHYLGEFITPTAGRHRDYIAWLACQDMEASQRHWGEILHSLEEPTLLADALNGSRDQQDLSEQELRGHGRVDTSLSLEATERLTRFARQERVTLNTLVQGAWLLLLRSYCGQSTVAFGATVAGRPAELPGSQETLGLFINTLPVIQNLRPDAKAGDWLRNLQDYNVALREHEHVPLYEIQRWAGRPGQALFDSIIVFENYPVDEALRQRSSTALRFGEVKTVNPNNYKMTLNVQVTNQLHCTLFM